MRKVIIIISILLIVVVLLFYKSINNYDGVYEIYVKEVDDYSPDRYLVVKRNGKETNKYQYIMYDNGEKQAILCYSKNPVANKFSLNVDNLIIILPNNEKKIAKLIKEEK